MVAVPIGLHQDRRDPFQLLEFTDGILGAARTISGHAGNQNIGITRDIAVAPDARATAVPPPVWTMDGNWGVEFTGEAFSPFIGAFGTAAGDKAITGFVHTHHSRGDRMEIGIGITATTANNADIPQIIPRQEMVELGRTPDDNMNPEQIANLFKDQLGLSCLDKGKKFCYCRQRRLGKMATTTTLNERTFADLLDRAVHEPGILSAAYSAFHDYSIGNQLLAWWQCHDRGLMPGPISTYRGWLKKGRHVQRGQKALVLCMPVTVKVDDDENPDETRVFTRFVYRPNWFVVSQTDGDPVETTPISDFDINLALSTLDITEVPFTMLNGNVQGYAQNRTIAVSPVAALPHKTRFHEMAHVLLGHTSETRLVDDDTAPRFLREVEAEAVAMMLVEILELPGAADARGYIQHWNQTHEPIPEKSAQKIFKVANQILKAGVTTPADNHEGV